MFKGSIPAIVTPFTEDLSVNYKKLEELLNWHVEQGSDGIVILGTTGESPTLSEEEKLRAIEFTVNVIAGRIPVIAGTGSNDTMSTIVFSQKVEKLGVDGLLVVTPYYNKSNTQGYINHFELIANSVNTPIILYNVPSRTGGSLPVEVVIRLSEHENIVALKAASGDLSLIAKYRANTPPNFGIFSGNDDQVVPVLSIGGCGVISVAANIIPKQFSDMVRYYQEGETSKASCIQLTYLELINSLFIETNPIPVKEMMNQLGHDVGQYRFPLYEMAEENKVIIKSIVEKYFK